MSRPSWLLTSYGFIAALALLLLNDLVLKSLMPGLVTGKLSDFVGLFVFPLFWSVLLPRLRTFIHAATALVFVWWKLPWSEPFIATWNAWLPISIGRTVDVTDLVALVSVWGAYRYSSQPRAHVGPAALRAVTVPLALVAFAATTFLSVPQYDRSYLFRTTPAQLQAHLRTLGITAWAPDDSAAAPPGSFAALARARADTLPRVARTDGLGDLNVRIPTDCCGEIEAYLWVMPDTAGAAVSLRGIVYRGAPSRHDRIHLVDFFERCFVQRLDSLLTDGAAVRGLAVVYPPGTRARRSWCIRQD